MFYPETYKSNVTWVIVLPNKIFFWWCWYILLTLICIKNLSKPLNMSLSHIQSDFLVSLLPLLPLSLAHQFTCVAVKWTKCIVDSFHCFTTVWRNVIQDQSNQDDHIRVILRELIAPPPQRQDRMVWLRETSDVNLASPLEEIGQVFWHHGTTSACWPGINGFGLDRQTVTHGHSKLSICMCVCVCAVGGHWIGMI